MAATKPAFNPPGKKGDMIFSALVKLAALIVLLLLGGIIVSLIFSSPAEHSKIWFRLPVDQRVGCAERYLRCAGADLRHAGDLFYRPANCGSGELRYCLVPDGTCAEAGCGVRWVSPLNCWRPSQVSFTACGACLFLLRCLQRTSEEPVGNVLSAVPFVGALFSGPAFGIGILAAGVILAIMIIPYIAAVMRDVFEQTPVMMKESAYGIGCTTPGSYLAHRPSVHQKWGDWRHYAGLRSRAR